METPRDWGDLKWAAVDLDGTLAEPRWTPDNPTKEIGPPIEANVDKCLALVAEGYKIVIHTARPWGDYEAIESWLVENGVPFRRIVCGKLLAAVYIDDRAINAEFPHWFPGEFYEKKKYPETSRLYGDTLSQVIMDRPPTDVRYSDFIGHNID